MRAAFELFSMLAMALMIAVVFGMAATNAMGPQTAGQLLAHSDYAAAVNGIGLGLAIGLLTLVFSSSEMGPQAADLLLEPVRWVGVGMLALLLAAALGYYFSSQAETRRMKTARDRSRAMRF